MESLDDRPGGQSVSDFQIIKYIDICCINISISYLESFGAF